MKKTRSKIDYTVPLLAQYFYHVFNRTNNRESLFIDDKDRLCFLKKYKQFMLPYVKTYCYNLLGNHFHLVIQVKRESEINSFIKSIPKRYRKETQEKYLNKPPDMKDTNQLISKQFSNFFTSYSTIFNKKHERSGNLFHRPFKRVFIENDSHYCNLIKYVHRNAQKHNIHPNFTCYPWSSYNSMLSEKSTVLEREAVLNWFGGKKRFVAFHLQKNDFSSIEHLLIED